jgi:hypothetical protein
MSSVGEDFDRFGAGSFVGTGRSSTKLDGSMPRAINPAIKHIRSPWPFGFAQDRLVEGQQQGFDRLSPNGIWPPRASPARRRAHRGRIRVFANLIDNTLAYAREATVTLVHR